MTTLNSAEHLFWARMLVKLSRDEAARMRIPEDIVAEELMVAAWTMLTGASEYEARKAVAISFAEQFERTRKLMKDEPAGSA